MGVERALRRTARARRVDEQRRVLRPRAARHDAGRPARQHLRELEHPGVAGPRGPPVAQHDVTQLRQVVPDPGHLRPVLAVRQEHPRPAVAEPVAERVGSEQPRQGHAHRPELEGREVGDRVLRGLRQHERDARPGLDPEGAEPARHPVREAAEVVEGVGLGRPVLGLPDEGPPAGPVGVPVAGVLGDVVGGRDPPRVTGAGVLVGGRAANSLLPEARHRLDPRIARPFPRVRGTARIQASPDRKNGAREMGDSEAPGGRRATSRQHDVSR